ncbi:hypothetical protein GGX14DRAFT_339046, partial [Mycena pura]
EDINFLRFACALKILVGTGIKNDQQSLKRLKQLIQDYLINFRKLYGEDNMKPNHHWMVHDIDQIVDFGPQHSIWAMLTERLNKLLKNLNSNNWTRGRLEVSMLREFQRHSAVTLVETLLKALRSGQGVGTVQDSARLEGEVDTIPIRSINENHLDHTEPRVRLGTKVDSKALSDKVRLELFNHYNRDRSAPRVHWPGEVGPPETKPLGSHADFYSSAFLDGRRIVSSSHSRGKKEGSSLIQVEYGHHEKKAFGGRVNQIFFHRQTGPDNLLDTCTFAVVDWMLVHNETPLENGSFPWDEFPELSVETWKAEYAPQGTTGYPPEIIPLSFVQSQLARGYLEHTKPPMWITIRLDRVR